MTQDPLAAAQGMCDVATSENVNFQITWKTIAQNYPAFVQWIVATYGPLPDGEVTQEDYETYAEAYRNHD